MEIGKPEKTVIVEPAEDPFRKDSPPVEPERVETPAETPEREEVPAGV